MFMQNAEKFLVGTRHMAKRKVKFGKFAKGVLFAVFTVKMPPEKMLLIFYKSG